MRRRLVISYLALTLLVVLVLEVPLAITYREREERVLESKLERDAFVLAAFAEDEFEGSADLDLQALADGYADRTGGRVVFVNDQGELRADSDPPVEGPRRFDSRPEIRAALTSEVAIGTRYSETLGTSIVFVAVPITSGGQVYGALRISYPTSELDARVRRSVLLLVGAGVISLAAAAVVGVILARWVTRPLEQLQTTAEAVGGGDLAARAPTDDGPPEVRSLARSMNATASRLEELVVAQEQFVADASHQLRTPLTALRLRLEMLAMEAGGPGESGTPGEAGGNGGTTMRSDIEAAEREVARLSRLVDGLLALARADRAPAAEVSAALDIDTALADRVAMWRPVADDREVRLEVVGAGLTAVVSADRFDQVLDNYLANAIEVSPPGSTITLSSNEVTTPGVGAMVEVHVVDEGPGLSEDERRQAFERFWRGDQRPSELGGSGLGLAIVRRLAALDSGRTELRAAASGGVDAVVTLQR
jgi:signal transduction histidine kinase